MPRLNTISKQVLLCSYIWLLVIKEGLQLQNYKLLWGYMHIECWQEILYFSETIIIISGMKSTTLNNLVHQDLGCCPLITIVALVNYTGYVHTWTINEPHLPCKIGLDVIQSHPLCRTCITLCIHSTPSDIPFVLSSVSCFRAVYTPESLSLLPSVKGWKGLSHTCQSPCGVLLKTVVK